MEVLVGPTFSIEVSAPPPTFVRDRSGVTAQDNVAAAAASASASPRLFLSEKSPEDSSESSSSIGSPGEREDEEDHDDAGSSKGGLGSLGSLEDSLPIKRGLSNHYAGKSKSFTNLSDVSTVKDLGKPENPFIKRRRVLMASKWSRRSSFYSWENPISMPLLALNEDNEEDGEDGIINPTSTSP